MLRWVRLWAHLRKLIIECRSEKMRKIWEVRRALKCMGEGLGIPELKSGDFKWWGRTEVQTSEWVRHWRKKYIGLKLVYFKGFGGWEVGSSQSVSSSSNELFNFKGHSSFKMASIQVLAEYQALPVGAVYPTALKSGFMAGSFGQLWFLHHS